jgi:hypothetical protein
MNVVVFTGPTLSAAEGARLLDATYLPPAAQGDVHRAALGGPGVIAIIDGYFEQVPWVAHKEVLWAMAQGIHVLGAASMGALRAAELAAFGMEGVGEVYAGYARGEITDDDEVALAHGRAEIDYRALSEPMVNVRATLRRAAAERVLGDETSAALVGLAKEMFYADRCWPAILAAGRAGGLPGGELAALQRPLGALRVDVKRQDAVALLRLIGARLAGGLSRKEVRYPFQHTDAWESMSRRVHAAGGVEGESTR